MTQGEKLIEIFPKLLKLFSEEIKTAYEVSIDKQFRKQDGKIFNNESRLRTSRGSGSLRADFIKNSKVEIKDGKIELEFATDKPYAGIQNRGGFIKARPTTNSKGKKTYKMAQYFWYKSFEANVKRKKELYKRIALSVEKKGGVKIKGKNYIENSVEHFEKNYLEAVIQEFFNEVAKVWNAN
jgi:hypothetical protein